MCPNAHQPTAITFGLETKLNKLFQQLLTKVEEHHVRTNYLLNIHNSFNIYSYIFVSKVPSNIAICRPSIKMA